MADYTVTIDRVDKSYGDVRAVREFSAALPSGSIYGFLGPNGAGKTTLIRMLLDIIHPDSGEVRLFGESDIRLCRDRVGYMPEERGLYRKMKVADVLAYIGSLRGMDKGTLNGEIGLWLGRLGLADRARSKVEELSRGMQQKLQFIATVISDPDLLIMDEPFSGLDPLNLDLIKSIMTGQRERGKTVIFSTHMMEQAEKLCDRLLLISNGEKVVDGTLEEVRSGFRGDSVLLEVEGDGAFLAGLPMVERAEPEERAFEVALKPGSSPRELLRAALEHAAVRSFRVKEPSLHEIFVRLVHGKEDGDAE